MSSNDEIGHAIKAVKAKVHGKMFGRPSTEEEPPNPKIPESLGFFKSIPSFGKLGMNSSLFAPVEKTPVMEEDEIDTYKAVLDDLTSSDADRISTRL